LKKSGSAFIANGVDSTENQLSLTNHGIRGGWEIQIWPFFIARKSPKNAKNLFDATPYPATTSDPIRAKNKNITGFEPRDLIDLDS
jgi:hypothetical protein